MWMSLTLTSLVYFYYLPIINCYIRTTYNSTNFFNNFVFQTIADPTHGTVQYVNYTTAVKNGLAKYVNNKVYLGVDYTSVLANGGRKSLRLQSNRVMNGNNLVIIDLEHMPSTVGNVLSKGCSLWPAFWSVGPNWPNNGEIDIIEYVNIDTNVSTALHTSNGCSMFSSSNSFTGSWGTKDCYSYASGQNSNAGCSIHGKNVPVGAAFNAQIGGVYAMEWDNSQYIRMFYFPRGSIPLDINNKNPDPSKWGSPYARFDITSSCDGNCQSTHFQDNKLIFDTTFCGDWAGNVFGSCSKTITCSDFVRNNPSEFSQAYWLINYIDIYDYNIPTSAPSSPPTTPLVQLPYRLSSTYNSTNFFNNFVFQTIADPTHGTVQYVNYTTAVKNGLAKYVNNKVYLGVDYTNVLANGGRKSLRLQSNRVMNGNNLVIIDLGHMPSTVGNVLSKGCSLWPAFWSVGPNWPNNGEIDIIEYVNKDSNVTTALHTSYGCEQHSVANTWYSGYVGSENCWVSAPNQASNAGCSFHGRRNSVGSDFNTAGGGVYAMEWDTRQFIRIFYFPKNKIPLDIVNKQPNPSSWGLPYARFNIGPRCTADCPAGHFSNHKLVFDTTFCGDWAGNVFGSCSKTIQCSYFVRNYPNEFSEAYWLINYIDIYDVAETSSKTYLGCYGDDYNRVMDLNYGSVGSIQECYNIAVNNNYNVFGLQYGGECWLSNNMTQATKLGLCGQCAAKGCAKPNCNCAAMKCPNGVDNCGDGRANALYQIKSINTLSPVSAPSVVVNTPTKKPTVKPSNVPTAAPVKQPTSAPSVAVNTPTKKPTVKPSNVPTAAPVKQPTSAPSVAVNTPTKKPTVKPSNVPTAAPVKQPTVTNNGQSVSPSTQTLQSSSPKYLPTNKPTQQISSFPTLQPSDSGSNTINTNSNTKTSSALNSIAFYSVLASIVVLTIIAASVYLLWKKSQDEQHKPHQNSAHVSEANLTDTSYPVGENSITFSLKGVRPKLRKYKHNSITAAQRQSQDSFSVTNDEYDDGEDYDASPNVLLTSRTKGRSKKYDDYGNMI